MRDAREPLERELSDEQLVLGDLLNHILDKGVVISGQVTISIADIDLLYLDLRLLLTSVQRVLERQSSAQHGDVPVLPPDAAPG
jgi:hypothetical protein